MSSQASSRGTGGGTMTWASSRRLVITNDVPQIVVANSASSRGHDRCSTTFSPYSPRSTNSPSTRGGFQSCRGGGNSNYQLRNTCAGQRGGELSSHIVMQELRQSFTGASCYAWRGSSNVVSNRGASVPITTYYRGANICQTRHTFYARNSTPPAMQLPTTSNRSPQAEPATTAPKFFPIAQPLAPTPQFVDGITPMPLQYQLAIRRSVHQVQPLPARRDIRFATPTSVMVSKKVPVGVDVPRITVGGTTNDHGDTNEDVNRATETKQLEQNRGDSDADEYDGRMSPDVLSTSLRSNEDTWDFWDRVYSDPELRQSMQERQRDSPMAELLHSDKLCKAQLVFLNVPRLAYGEPLAINQARLRYRKSNYVFWDIEEVKQKQE
ncbi:hypothetical protein ANCDUO_22506 [Ancylostoma duodenale]|uniref:Uncharacterized protein n=1 Tax=Ancylostoma duodenale TaxID=51022 RepID=A0A0C2FFS2_9BILA|nr:hypothetical protein ANCDUO_22506 [Ancylostoma duodenale]